MKKIAIFTLVFVSFTASAQTQEVISSITTFFDGLQTRDTLKIKTVCDKELLLQTIVENDFGSQLQREATSKFYKSVAAIPSFMKIEERLLDYKVLIDGPMAQVWTPYEFYINDKISHVGVNSFTLQLDNNPKKPIWKIVHIIDTRRRKQ